MPIDPSGLERLLPSETVEAIQRKYSQASEGHDAWDVLAAATFHFLACYGMTHTEEQHRRMVRLVMGRIHEDALQGKPANTERQNAGGDNSAEATYYYALVGEPAEPSGPEHYSPDDTIPFRPIASCTHQHAAPDDVLPCFPPLLETVKGLTAIAVVMEVDQGGHRRVVPMTDSMRAAVKQIAGPKM
jgi:hypothetical protein